MPTKKRIFGDFGEKAAQDFLKNSGYSILKTNYQKRIGEIDIIAKLDNTLCFIEIKTRTNSSSQKYGLPQESISYYKKKKLIKTALFYLFENNYSDNTNWQIDVIAITASADRKIEKINHIKNAVNYDELY